jgi:hypothetical protein
MNIFFRLLMHLCCVQAAICLLLNDAEELSYQEVQVSG